MNIYNIGLERGYVNRDVKYFNVLAKSAEEATQFAARYAKANHNSDPEIVSVKKELVVHINYSKAAKKK